METEKSVKKTKPNPWLDHCKKISQEHPEIPYKEVLKRAKSTYKPMKPRKEKPKPATEISETPEIETKNLSDSDSDSEQLKKTRLKRYSSRRCSK